MSEAAVIGGGLVGAAIAYGLARHGMKPLLLDEGDTAHRAARGNFGLIWTQSKGDGAPVYQGWTMDAADAWPAFAADLQQATGLDLSLRRPGGLHLCLSEAEFEARAALMQRLEAQNPARFRYRMLRGNELADLAPGIGPEVAGGSFAPMDGDCDPLSLLRALHAAILAQGGRIETGARVERIERQGGGYALHTARGLRQSDRVVIAAGLGGPALAKPLDIDVSVRPLRGQILITERMPRWLDLPTTSIRQTNEGTLQLGDSQEEAGFDSGTSLNVMRDIAARAARSFPALAKIQVMRAWGALRVMTRDGLPVYRESPTHRGVYYATCHSGVTLAPNHAGSIADWIAGEGAPPDPFFADRPALQGEGAHVPFA